MYKSRVYKLLTWIVVCAQILMVAGTATVGVVQPTPQMVSALAAEAGWSDWVSAGLGVLTRRLQPLWGEPTSAKASAIRDVGPHPYYQWLTTVHPEENLVVNGSFELGPEGLNITSIPGWTIASGKVDLWNGYFNPDGSFSEIDLAGTPGPGVLEQTLTGLVAGQSYFFEFSYSANTFANEQAKVQVLDGGTPLIDQTVTAAGHPYSAGWQHFRQSFTAPASGSVKLRFQDLSVDPHIYHGVIIDDVRVARRLINYVLNHTFEAGPHGLNTTIIPNWTVESGRVDIHGGYFHPDRSTAEMDLAGTPGPGTASQVVSGLTAGQSYVFEFDYTVNAFPNEQARVQLLDGGTSLINQVVTVNGDANHKGWKHFRQTFTAPASGTITLRFQDLSTDVFTSHGIMIDNVRVADEPLNYVINGDFESAPYALNIANDAIPGWTVTSGPVDNFNPGLLYEKAIDLNGSPGNGKIEQTVTGLQAGQVYAFQFNYENHAWLTTYAYARLLDSANAKLYEKRISCKGHVVHEGWCTLRYFFTAPANGQVKIVFENDETDGNAYYGTNIDNVFISRNLNYVVNGNFTSGPIGLNQTHVPGWSVAGPTDTHDGFGGEYRFTVDLNGSPGDGKLRQVINGLAPGQSYTLRYNYASTAHNYLVNFDVKVTDSTGTNTLVLVNQSTNQLPYVGGWRQAEHTFTAPADGVVQVNFLNNETDNNPYYAAIIDNIQLWGTAATAGMEVNVCNSTIVLPKPALTVAPGGVGAGLEHWVRADKEVFSDAGTTAAVEGDTVQQWNDLSGNGLDLTQSTAAQKPIYRIGVARGNFNPALDFTDDFIRNTSRVVQTTDDLTMIAVGDTDVTGGVRSLYAMGDNYNDPTMDLDGTRISPWFDSGGSVDLFTSETLPTNQAMIWGMRGANEETDGMHFNYSGEDVAMDITVADQANYGQNIGVGSDGGGEDWDGRIPEAMVYSRNLSPAEMDRVYSYLALKYGITLRLSTVSGSRAPGNYVSSKGQTVWNYSGNSNYHNDMAGIARDDASALEQKQANSVNSDNLITIGLGGIAATNADNINSFDADQSFLLWGNDNGATTLATSVSVSLTRMARIWTVQETTPITAPLGVVTMRVPQSAFSLGAGQAAFLLRSVDPLFTNADEVIFFTCDGTTCETTINFADGDYFTLARASVAPEITVSPTSQNFGSLGTTETSPVRNVTISNVGNAPLNLTSIQMTNDGSGQFVNSNSCGAILNPGASCVAGVTFTPNANGAQSGVLTIASNDSDEASTVVNLSGTGVAQAPDITVAPTTLTFTDTVVNSAAPAQSVIVSNVGTGNLAIQNLTVSGANSDQFVIVPPGSSCTPLTKNLAGGENCDVEVLFSPTSAGAKSASLIIASNDTDEITSTVTLNGVGVTCSGALNTVTLAADDLEIIDNDNKAAACVTLTALPTLTIGKSGPATATQGTNFDYTLVITNSSTTATSGVITVTDTLPAGLSFISGSGGGFTCAASGQNVTCASSSVIAANNGTATITLTVTPTTTGAKGNTASVVGGGDTSVASSNTVNTTVTAAPSIAPGGVSTNLRLWLKADTGVTGGSAVTTWADQSGNGFDFTRQGLATSPNGTQTLVNFNAAVTFNGTTDELRRTAALLPNTANTDDTGNQSFFWAQASNDFGYILAVENAIGNVTPAVDSSGAYQHDQNGGTFTRIGGGSYGTIVNGVVRTLTSVQTMQNGLNQASGPLTTPLGAPIALTVLGRRTNPSQPFPGALPEMIVYDRALTALEQQQVQSYLALKYGVTLDVATPYLLADGATQVWADATYKYNVAGIGRDDASGLNQKQSKSVNFGGLVTIGLGTIAANNAANPNSFAANKDFLVFGDDNGVRTNWSTSGAPTGRQRLPRTWKVRETGTVGTVKVQVPDNSAVLSTTLPAEVTTVYLLVDTDTDFSSGATEIPLTLNGANWETTTDFSNGQFFTFATLTPPDLTIAKSAPATATQGTNFSYTLVVTNAGSAATSGTVTVTDTLPAGLSFVSSSGFTCAASGQDVTCTSSAAIAANGTATIILTVNPTTPGVKSNTASVIGGGDSSAATSNTVNTTVAGVPDLTVTIGQPSPAFVAGVASNVPMTVSNIGNGPTTGPITTTMTLPANTSAPASFTSGVWSCTTVGQTVTCTQPGPINAGASSTIQVPVTASPATVGTQPGPFNGGVSTPGDSNPGNNPSAPMTPTTPVTPAPTSSITLPTLKLFLAGAYDTGSGLMRDDLRSKSLLPTTSPYGSAPGIASSGVFSVTGNNAIVDWVLVEVRDAVTPATITASKAAFVQRDGDVVALDGTSALTIAVGSGNYHVAVQHRNHLGAMTANPVALSLTTPVIDFTTSAGYGANAQATVGGVYALWMGNTSGDNRIIGAGPNNDRNAILSEALSAPGNTNHNANYIVTAYSTGDVNLDGRVIAAGPGNDINFILYNVFVHPGNGSAAANFVVQGQVP